MGWHSHSIICAVHHLLQLSLFAGSVETGDGACEMRATDALAQHGDGGGGGAPELPEAVVRPQRASAAQRRRPHRRHRALHRRAQRGATRTLLRGQPVRLREHAGAGWRRRWQCDAAQFAGGGEREDAAGEQQQLCGHLRGGGRDAISGRVRGARLTAAEGTPLMG
jgi:hypothetical protein